MPATEKQGRGEPCNGEHPDVFRHEESCVFETRVFGHVAGDNFRFTFGHIEWSAIRFHKTGYKKQNERSCTPRREDKPAWHEAKCVSSLRSNNPVGYKRADDHHHREHGNYERQFVADHLRDSAHSPEHREFVIASPSGHEDRKLRCRSNRKEKQDAAIDRKRRQKYSEQRENINQTRRDLDNPARRGCQPCQQTMLGVNEDLVDRLAHVGMKKTVNSLVNQDRTRDDFASKPARAYYLPLL